MTDLADAVQSILDSEYDRFQAQIDRGLVGPKADAGMKAELAEVKAMLLALAERIDTRPTMGSMTVPAMTLSPVFNMPEQAPPTVNVYPSDQLPPVVNVTPAEVIVNVPSQPAPVVNVPAPIVNVESVDKAGTIQDVRVVDMPTRTTTVTKKIKRDRVTNLITEVVGTEVEE